METLVSLGIVEMVIFATAFIVIFAVSIVVLRAPQADTRRIAREQREHPYSPPSAAGADEEMLR